MDPLKSPLEDTIWGSIFGSYAAVQANFDRFGPDYHDAILASGVPMAAAECLMPHLRPLWQGIDFGCGSGVMGLSLRRAGLVQPLDGIDLSAGMLKLASATGCYRQLHQQNLLQASEGPDLAAPYDFAVTLGLVGDYIPFYAALPRLLPAIKPGGWLGLGVEPKSTPERPLLWLMDELGLVIQSETVLSIPEAQLERETYHFFVARVA